MTQVKTMPPNELIPSGAYCYAPLEIVRDEEKGFRMKIDACPFYSSNWCSLLDVEIEDQVKECNINDNDEIK